MKNTLILFILVSFYIASSNFISGCKDETPVTPGKTIVDTNILRTDEFGNILGGDTTDWCIHDSADVTFGPAYPNPVVGPTFSIKFHVAVEDTVKIYILKSNTDTVSLYEGRAMPGYYSININGSDYKNTYQRIYFKSKHFSSSRYCRFYGDIKFEE